MLSVVALRWQLLLYPRQWFQSEPVRSATVTSSQSFAKLLLSQPGGIHRGIPVIAQLHGERPIERVQLRPMGMGLSIIGTELKELLILAPPPALISHQPSLEQRSRQLVAVSCLPTPPRPT
jgi:hypothetical protein